MRYELRFSSIALLNLQKVPEQAVKKIRDGFDRLAEDPKRFSRPAVCPPFAPFGYQCDIPCDIGAQGKFNCVVFFVYSDDGAALEIHRMLIQVITPPYATAASPVRGKQESSDDGGPPPRVAK